jgi:hypothetical protein
MPTILDKSEMDVSVLILHLSVKPSAVAEGFTFFILLCI